MSVSEPAPERRHVHPARVRDLVIRRAFVVLNSILLYHDILQRAGWQAKRRCVWQLSDVGSPAVDQHFSRSVRDDGAA